MTVAGCEPCTATSKLVARFVADNRSCGISLRLVDAETDAKEVVRTGALIHPTMILEVDGQERAHLTGELTHRRLLRKTLPVLYDDDRAALAQLRRQMNSPTEKLLGTVSLFAGLNKRQLSRLARLAEELHAAAADQLTAEGDPGDEFFVVRRVLRGYQWRSERNKEWPQGGHAGPRRVFWRDEPVGR